MDHEKMAQDLATAFAVSQQVVDTERPQIQLQKMLEDSCAAYGFFRNRSDEFIEALIRRGEVVSAE